MQNSPEDVDFLTGGETPFEVHEMIETRLRKVNDEIAALNPARVMSNPASIRNPLFELIAALRVVNQMVANNRPYIDEGGL